MSQSRDCFGWLIINILDVSMKNLLSVVPSAPGFTKYKFCLTYAVAFFIVHFAYTFPVQLHDSVFNART